MEYKSNGVAVAGEGVSGGGKYIMGYASTFGAPADAVNDIVESGAFAASIKENPSPPLLWSHKSDELPIGKIDLLREDEHGLFFRAVPLRTRMGKDAKVAVDAGSVTGVSIGYDVEAKNYVRGTRHLEACKLWEISLCNFPANSRARLSASGKAALLELLYIAETDALQAVGHPIGGDRLKKYVQCQVWQAERDLYAGHTIKWWTSELWRRRREREREWRRELAVLGRELRALR
jgi:HK97 family phage prohead protease